jgi:hypothetical protein
MKLFIKKTGIFFCLLAVICMIGILLPVTRRTSANLLFGQVKKDSLLRNVSSSRIIFVGGSNLSFGLNSQLIYDSLHIYPINTAVHANLGLVYMMDHTLPFIKKNDVVVISPEYQQFYGDIAFGGEELIRTLVEISPQEIVNLKRQQVINMLAQLPRYSFSKFKPSEYLISPDLTGIYSVNSFNKFGDACTHWSKPSEKAAPDAPISLPFNALVVEKMKSFEQSIKEKEATLYIIFPGYEAASFDNSKQQIEKLFTEIKNSHFNILGTPEQFKMPDSLIFNTNYHLTKQGADLRTNLLISDLKAVNAIK